MSLTLNDTVVKQFSKEGEMRFVANRLAKCPYVKGHVAILDERFESAFAEEEDLFMLLESKADAYAMIGALQYAIAQGWFNRD